MLRKPVLVRGKIVADGRHDERIAIEQLQVIGNVASGATKFAAHFRHVKRHTERVNFVWQDVVFEFILKHHDGVIG